MPIGEGFFPVGSSANIALTLTDAQDDSVVTGATVTGVLTDEDGDTVEGSLTGVERGATGVYDVTIPSTASMAERKRYVLTLTAVSAGLKLVLELAREARAVQL